jgi:3-oxoacyl-[acyl-carrier protein] reductase
MQLSAAGMHVAVNYAHGADTANTVVNEIVASGGFAAAFQADVSNEEEVARMFVEVRTQFGPVDTLVNNAGIWNFQPLLDVTTDEYRRHTTPTSSATFSPAESSPVRRTSSMASS